MGCCVRKSLTKSSSLGRKTVRMSKTTKSCAKSKKHRCYGRNPFFRFLAYFRNCNRGRLGHLSSREIVLKAGRQWTRMSSADKEPFISAARNFNYTYRSRSRKINWLLGRLQAYAADGEEECRARALWLLIRGIRSWRQDELNEMLECLHN